MKTITQIIFSVLVFLLDMLDVYGQATDNWHYPLYLSNLGYWHSRIPVEVKNLSTHDVFGESVRMKIGNGIGQLNLVGMEAAGIRIVDSTEVMSYYGGLLLLMRN